MDFYGKKARDKPRFLYRNLADGLDQAERSGGPAARKALLDSIGSQVAGLKAKGDWLKMKWCLPPALAAKLTEPELAQLDAALANRRERRNDRLLEVFPHCSDEFTIDTAFLDAAFGATRSPRFNRQTAIRTLGSCFAHNIAQYLEAQGYQARSFRQAEDLNSPFSNAKMLAICAADEPVQRAYIERWIDALYPPEMINGRDALIDHELKRLQDLAGFIRASDVLIVTFGNIIDYFLPADRVSGEPGPAVAPKFFAVSEQEDVELRAYLTARMKEQGAEFRLGSPDETAAALASQHAALRHLNPTAHIFYTLSPVPIDSALGLTNPLKRGAVELDCISKSSLRVALAQFMEAAGSGPAADASLEYFPSFEIVRWIAPNGQVPVFGNEDAASRHVSQAVLSGIYRYFITRYATPE